jgi:hypothetical protein
VYNQREARPSYGGSSAAQVLCSGTAGHSAPNKGTEPTASSVRSYLAPASGSGSCLAFGNKTKRSRESTLAATECRKMHRGFLLTWASVAIPSQNPKEILKKS